ncbi:MAG TPA: FxsA family protein [Micromonosporaceae bacterium]|nr:FxsA family protein [Micromonosporaceae bacterium]
MGRGLKLVPPVLLLTAIAEVVVFVLIGQWIGFGWTVLLVLAASLLGAYLLRREGMRAWQRFRAAASTGGPPGTQVTDGLVGLAAGLLLAVPGLLTGLAGLLLMLPPVRRLARHGVQRAAERRMSPAVVGDLFGPRRVRVQRGRPQQSAQPRVQAEEGPPIEGEIVEPRQP